MNISREDINKIANEVGLDYARLMAFVSVESGGMAFGQDGKIIIQFEPTWFHRYLNQFSVPHTYTSSLDQKGRKQYTISSNGKTLTNGVSGQIAEWQSFDIAYSIHPKSALLSTSIGLMQIMGFNYAACGYSSVDEMWDDFKKGEIQQLEGGARYIKSNPALFNALRNKNWPKVAYYYNGEGYKINNYDVKLAAAYMHYSV